MPGGVVTGLLKVPSWQPSGRQIWHKNRSPDFGQCVSMAWQAQGRVHVCHHGMEGRGARGSLHSFTASSAAVKT